MVRRHRLATRLTHALWALCLYFLLLSGLQIFNAHPALYLGHESGFFYENAILQLDDFPGWLTIPSIRDLATGRVVHFFFAWIFIVTLLVWFAASLGNRHLRKDLLPRVRDFRGLGRDLRDHLGLRLRPAVRYAPLQKLTYAGVLFGLFPMIAITGLCLSPAMNAVLPWLPELFGGRQGARTAHFAVMALLVMFFAVHMVMMVLSGPLNALRAIVTGRMRITRPPRKEPPHV